ncbi:unnamed protein product [Paramecium sonneborni]|uniref:Uncharacterized protein n=1 Tax=Paramecium sonneborni TaxID=65129 RepID=A0A8S1MIS3_9CILI|nr:unnamed protein product [Paramecium sonneborni]
MYNLCNTKKISVEIMKKNRFGSNLQNRQLVGNRPYDFNDARSQTPYYSQNTLNFENDFNLFAIKENDLSLYNNFSMTPEGLSKNLQNFVQDLDNTTNNTNNMNDEYNMPQFRSCKIYEL